MGKRRNKGSRNKLNELKQKLHVYMGHIVQIPLLINPPDVLSTKTRTSLLFLKPLESSEIKHTGITTATINYLLAVLLT